MEDRERQRAALNEFAEENSSIQRQIERLLRQRSEISKAIKELNAEFEDNLSAIKSLREMLETPRVRFE